MSILFLTDLHIKISSFFLIDQLESFLKEWFKTNSVSYIVIGGDTLDTHERVCVHALNKTYKFLKFLLQQGDIFILVGNHDYINNSQFLTDQHWLNVLKEWPGIVVVDRVVEKDNILFVPYVPVGRFNEAVATAGQISPTLIFAHQEFKGCRLGHIISTQGDVWTGPLVISGHIHEPHQVGNNIIYPGASIAHGTGSRSFGPCCVSFEGKISYLGFETANPITTIQAPFSQLPQNSKICLQGTKTNISLMKGNPILKPFLVKVKYKIIQPTFQEDCWENHVVKNLKTKIMKDDWEEISRFD